MLEDTGIRSLTDDVQKIRYNPRVRGEVVNRIQEFIQIREAPSEKWYQELVYCLLTAYSSALLAERILGTLTSKELLTKGTLNGIREVLVEAGHRFPEQRAQWIYESRYLRPLIKDRVESFPDPLKAREWLRKNVKGLGWKESSHFLRNIGYLNVAIIDRHILSNMKEYGLIENTQLCLTKGRYLKYEEILGKAAKLMNMTLGEMDLYLWYRKTGKVLK